MTPEPAVYRIAVQMFGGVCSPSYTRYALWRVPLENGSGCDPETLMTVADVDDCLSSLSSTGASILLRDQLYSLQSVGGFRLRKWLSIAGTCWRQKASQVKSLDLA